MILSNVTIPLLGMVDTAVMGHLPDAAFIGAVAIGAVIFSFVFWGFGFLRMGTTGLVAQAFGREDTDGLRATLAQALLLAGGVALVLLLAQSPIANVAFTLIQGSADVEALAGEYFRIRIWGAPATLAGYVIMGWFLGVQNARVPLAIMLTINLTNIGLDLLFVLGLGMTVKGVALASVIAEYLGVALGLILIRGALRRYPGRLAAHRVLDRASFGRMLSVNQHIFIRTLCLIFAFAFFTSQAAAFGDVILAANAVLLNFQSFMAYGLDGFAHAAEALVGRYLGARDRRGFFRSVRLATGWSVAVALLTAVLFAVGGSLLIDALTDIPEVRAAARHFLPWMVLSPLVSVWSFLLDGVFIGATRGREMRDAMVVATILVYLPVWYLSRGLGNHGLWLAFLAFMAARALTMGWAWRRMLVRDVFGLGTRRPASG